MINYIDKKLWYINEYYNNKFHHKNIIIKRCLKYNNCNLDFINNNKNSLSKINKDLKEFRNSLNLKCKYFIKIPDNINYQILIKSFNFISSSFISPFRHQ